MQTDTVVIGASAAGLATAACLARARTRYVLLEEHDEVAHAWRHRYDRLCLHTTRRLSGLPFHPMPGSYPRYPSRDQVIRYLEDYASTFSIEPLFGQRVTSARREAGGWVTETARGVRIASSHVVVATGQARVPHVPTWPGEGEYDGELFHSTRYTNGERFRGKSVLVVGFGNSGGEIAIDLHEHGASPTVAVRGEVNVVPRDLFGVPVVAVGLAMAHLPARFADTLARPLVHAAIGSVTALGLRPLPYGPNVQIREHARIPLLDVGTIDLVRRGHVRIASGVRRFTPDGVEFDDGSRATFDAVVLATGYRAALSDFLEGVANDAVPGAIAGEALPGLYFCGFRVTPSGMLREIGIEAEGIAESIARGPRALSASLLFEQEGSHLDSERVPARRRGIHGRQVT